MLKKIINPRAYSKIIKHVEKPYILNSEGENFVVCSNRDLPTKYFDHLFFPITNYWRMYFEEKINIISPQNKKCFLDVCCGTGTLCLNVFPTSGFEKCIAIDNSETATSALHSRLNHNYNIEVRNEDITKTSFDSNSLDAVYGNSFLHHLPNNYVFLKEAYRILSPGGVIVMTGEPTISAPFLEGFIMNNIIKLLTTLHLKKRKISNADAPVTDIWLYEENSLRSMLLQVGFTEIIIKKMGVLVSLLNGATSFILRLCKLDSMQPVTYWKFFGWLDKKLFFWLPANNHSHFVIAARKPSN